ncbi:MAG: ABC transporter ATP-binding protein [Candidatus Eremiobacteraeota bacterium]|nr:ABC transporter ATP-binding protein [Candidatus Eremiobacteraeota bacterium]
MIECEGLTKAYGDFVALDNLSLKIDRGDTFGFIGPNGAGKTTAMRILSTLLEPTSGTAHIGGISVIDNPDEIRKLLGYMPDAFGVYDGMKVWEYLDFFAGAYRLPKESKAQSIADVLELTELTQKREFFVEALSTGMRQRLCLAKTLLHDPQVLILDEPASGLDPRARIEMRELLRELTRMGKTIMISSHILPELADFCNMIGILEAGSLITAGRVDDIMATLQSDRRITVSLLRNGEKAAQLLEADEHVSDIEMAEGERVKITFAYTGELELLANLTHQLAYMEFGLVGFEEEKTDLEDLFLRVTEGIVR